MLLRKSSIESPLNFLLKKIFYKSLFHIFCQTVFDHSWSFNSTLLYFFCLSKKTEAHDGFCCTLCCYWSSLFQEFTISLDRIIAICFSKRKLNQKNIFFLSWYILWTPIFLSSYGWKQFFFDLNFLKYFLIKKRQVILIDLSHRI